MPVHNLQLKNFKSLVDVKIEFRKLTLLMGPNNSGKSTVLQSLGFLKQSLPANSFTTAGPYARLGSFEDIMFKHSREGQIEISIYLTLPETELNEIRRIFRGEPFNEANLSRIGFNWTFSPNRGFEMTCLIDADGKIIACGSPHRQPEAQRIR